MDPETLSELHPYLYHMTGRDAWPGIKRHGLLSTSALLDLFGWIGDSRAPIEAQRRDRSIQLTHADLGSAVIRDNLPINPKKLSACLVDMTVEEWFRLLNRKVFFWLTSGRLVKLQQARPYRDSPHCVIELSTRSIVDSYLDKITLSPINTGSTLFDPPERGSDTMARVVDFDFDYWVNRRRSRANAIAEFALDYSLPEIVEHVRSVSVMQAGRHLESLL